VRKRILFTVQTPLGYRVALSRDRWREITRFKHPALAGHENQVRKCLLDPEVIRASTKDFGVHIYYSRQGRDYICVVVGAGDHEDRFIITAYFTKEIKKGLELWKK
jgi:hypothetical protein